MIARVTFVASEDTYLKIRKVKICPSISLAHEVASLVALRKGSAAYPIRRVECKSFIIAAEIRR